MGFLLFSEIGSEELDELVVDLVSFDVRMNVKMQGRTSTLLV